MNFRSHPLLVVVWSQKGCPACEEFLPRFREVAKKYQQCIPAAIVDANEYENEANSYWVRGTPTTMILRYGRRSPYILDGAASSEQIETFYGTIMRGLAIHGMECEI